MQNFLMHKKKERTVQDVFDTLTEEQREAVDFIIFSVIERMTAEKEKKDG
jgi:hypothetical protein